MEQKVLQIKDSNVLAKVQQCRLEDFKDGRRNYTIFQVGKATLLRVSDILRLKQTDVFDMATCAEHVSPRTQDRESQLLILKTSHGGSHVLPKVVRARKFSFALALSIHSAPGEAYYGKVVL